MKFNFAKYFPTGYEYKAELWTLGGWLTGSMVYSFSFFLNYYHAYGKLFFYDRGKEEWILKDGVFMEGFSLLSEGIFKGFYLGVLLLGILALCHYHYYYQGSKSIYLMKRLPDRKVLLKSCICVPVVLGIFSIILMIVLSLLYFGFYMWVTPEECIRYGQQIWSIW